jgi:hypothetical protein
VDTLAPSTVCEKLRAAQIHFRAAKLLGHRLLCSRVRKITSQDLCRLTLVRCSGNLK